MYKSIIKVSIGLLFCVFSFNTKSQPKSYHTDYHIGLSVSLPFTPISQERVKLIENGMNDITGTDKKKLLLVFLINDKDYPNIQVYFQAIPTLNNTSFDNIVKTFKETISDPETINWAKKKLTPLMKIVKLESGKPLVNYDKKMYLYIMKANTKDYGTLVNIYGFFALRNGLASISFVCKEIEIKNYTNIIYSLFESVNIDKDYIHN